MRKLLTIFICIFLTINVFPQNIKAETDIDNELSVLDVMSISEIKEFLEYQSKLLEKEIARVTDFSFQDLSKIYLPENYYEKYSLFNDKTYTKNLSDNYNSDTTKNYFIKFFRGLTIKQDLSNYPLSVIKIDEQKSNDVFQLESILERYFSDTPIYTFKNIYYADGSVEEALDDDEFVLSNTKFVDSVDVNIKFFYPKTLKKIKLSKNNISYKDNVGFVNLLSIGNYEANLIISKNVYSGIIFAEGITSKGESIPPDRTSMGLFPSDEEIELMRKTNLFFKETIKNIENNKYKTTSEIKQHIYNYSIHNYQTKTDDTITKRELSYHFLHKINEIDLFYVTEIDSTEIDVTLPNSHLQEDNDYRVINYSPENYGIIDKMGNWIIQPEYEYLEHYRKLLFGGYKDAETVDGSEYLYKLNTKNKTLKEYDFGIYEQAGDKYYIVEKEADRDITDKGVIDYDGNIIIPIKYNEIYYDHGANMFLVDVLAPIRGEYNTKGLFTEEGKELLPPIFLEIQIENGYIYVTHNNENKNTILYDINLKQITPDNWDVRHIFSEKVPLVMANDSNNGNEPFYIDKHGNIIIPPSDKYGYRTGFNNNRAVVSYFDKQKSKFFYGYIDMEGKIAIPTEYSRAENFNGKYAYVEKDDKVMLIDENNNIHKILPAKLAAYVMSHNPEDIFYYLENGENYDSNGNKVKE